jgi:hypothetical protein
MFMQCYKENQSNQCNLEKTGYWYSSNFLCSTGMLPGKKSSRIFKSGCTFCNIIYCIVQEMIWMQN